MILITGHRGFIGSRLTKELDARGLAWVGYDLQEDKDIRDKFKLYTIFHKEGIKQVIHLCARAGVRKSELFADEYITTNISGTRKLTELSKMFGVEHFIFFSSSSVYGETLEANKEEDILHPDSLYGITKMAGEEIVKTSGVPSTIIRPFTVYGEHGRKDQVIFRWINQIRFGEAIDFFGDGSTRRGYTYVGDLVDGVLKILDRGADEEVQIFNLGGSESISLKDVLDIFKEQCPDMKVKELPLPKGDVPDNMAVIVKAKNLLGWEPKTNFKEKVKEIIGSELNI